MRSSGIRGAIGGRIRGNRMIMTTTTEALGGNPSTASPASTIATVVSPVDETVVAVAIEAIVAIVETAMTGIVVIAVIEAAGAIVTAMIVREAAIMMILIFRKIAIRILSQSSVNLRSTRSARPSPGRKTSRSPDLSSSRFPRQCQCPNQLRSRKPRVNPRRRTSRLTKGRFLHLSRNSKRTIRTPLDARGQKKPSNPLKRCSSQTSGR